MNKYRRTLAHYRRKLERKARELNVQKAVPKSISQMIDGRTDASILDIGSGPFSMVGTQHESSVVKVTAADILADQFNDMMTEKGIVPIIPVERQDACQLTYQDESFDVVHCVNAIDHLEGVWDAFAEIYRVCKPGGWIYLKHYENCGERNGYGGLHFWNITIDNGLLLWTPRCRFRPPYPYQNQYVRYNRQTAIESILKKEAPCVT